MRICICLAFIILPQILSAQVNLINLGLIDSSENVLYVGIDNQIKLKTARNAAEYDISINGPGSIRKRSGNEYDVLVSGTGTCTLNVMRGGNKVFMKEYRIESIPDPIATVSGLRDTTLKKARILANPFLMVVLPGCYLRNPYHVTSFVATFIKDADSTSVVNNTGIFSEEVIQQIKTLAPNDRIYFHDIRAVTPDTRTRKLTPFWIKIE